MTTTQTEQVSATAALPGTDVVTRWEFVTQERAAAYLQRNTKNRSIRSKHVLRMVDDLKSGRYVIHHQGLAFDDRGVMIDGQHRCTAIVASGVPAWMLVTEGLPHEVQAEVDGGNKRQVADFLDGRYKSVKTGGLRVYLAVTERMHHQISVTGLNPAMQEVTKAEILAAAPQYNDLMDQYATSIAVAARNTRGAVGQAGLMGAVLYYPDRADEFLRGIMSMDGLANDDPRMALLRYRGIGRVQAPNSAFVALKAARAFHFGTPMISVKGTKKEVIDLRKSPRVVNHEKKAQKAAEKAAEADEQDES